MNAARSVRQPRRAVEWLAKRWAGLAALTGVALGVSAPKALDLYHFARAFDSPFVATLDAIFLPLCAFTVIMALLDAGVRQRASWEASLLPAEPPDPTVLYRLYDTDDVLLYAGITRTLDERMGDHGRDKDWWPEVARTATEHYETRREAARAEYSAIAYENPRYNIRRLARDAHLRAAGVR